MEMDRREFALYLGDDLVMFGTIEEIAKARNVKESTIKSYATPSFQRRHGGRGYSVVEVTGWDEDD